MGLALRNANTRYTYADYLTWPEDVRYELIDGIAYPISPAPDGVAHAMSPAPLRVHQELLGAIYREAANALDGKPCRPTSRGPARCVHGRPTICRTVHDEDDPLIGQPICPECYDTQIRPQLERAERHDPGARA